MNKQRNSSLNELRKIFAAQHRRRVTRAPVSHLIAASSVKYGINRTIFFVMIAILAISVAIAYEYTRLTFYTVAPSTFPTLASESPQMAMSAGVTLTATPVTGTVCTNVPGGRLHVRVAPGEGNAEVGHLTEGEPVTINASTKAQTASDGGTWIELIGPLSGWVNQTYICRE
jgi:hypothetical protein